MDGWMDEWVCEAARGPGMWGFPYHLTLETPVENKGQWRELTLVVRGSTLPQFRQEPGKLCEKPQVPNNPPLVPASAICAFEADAWLFLWVFFFFFFRSSFSG